MNMIDVMKRLAELDANNPTIVKENTNIEECGMMPMPGMGGMDRPSTPATLNVTAGSGEELGNMLSQIMSLAGVHRVEPEHLGIEHDPMSLTAEPTVAGPVASSGDEMRNVIDKLNPMDDEDDVEKTAEDQYNNSPSSARNVPSFDHDAMLNKGMHNQDQAGSPGQGDRFDGKNPKAFPTFEAQLMDEYRNFVAEDSDRMISSKEIDAQAVYQLISQFDQRMNEIYAYGDPDYRAAIAALQQGDVETAIGAVVDTYGDRNGGEVRDMDQYAKDLQDEFEYLVQGGDQNKGVAEGGASNFHVFYKDNAKRGQVVKTEVKASSREEAESAFKEWNSSNTPGRFSFVSARPVDTGMMEGSDDYPLARVDRKKEPNAKSERYYKKKEQEKTPSAKK